ncbi:hypothetical protein Bhyg_03749 [Pseudolycoriella hygida]|uniref:Uncharacterized protein n=1 Tax=Pseudolycoriella hygida TaxID=35572 RepID=A0A9Q0S7S5_9DIPT|nr:hypothetical protein Bhyg_03749 [Pseudolycoriella hygida]
MKMIIQLSSISCSSEVNFINIKALLERLCPPNFAIETLVGTRNKKIRSGKCCWTAHYRANTTINSKTAFTTAVKLLTVNIPFSSEVVATGRYGSNIYGIFITCANNRCICVLDFELASTTFRVEPITDKKKIIFITSINRTLVGLFGHDDDSDDDGDNIFVFLDLTLTTMPYRAKTDQNYETIKSDNSTESLWYAYRKDLLGENDLLDYSRLWRLDSGNMVEIPNNDASEAALF